MESRPLSNMSSLRKLGSSFSLRMSRSNGIPQDPVGSSRSPTWDKEEWNEMMRKPQIRRIFYIFELDMLLLNLIGKLKTESTQNQLKQQIEQIKMNVELLIHERDLLHFISELNLKEFDDLLAASHTTDQASTQHDDLVKKIKEIYNLLENTKANTKAIVGQFDGFRQNLIEAIIKLIQQYHEEVKAEHQLAPSRSGRDPNRLRNDVTEHIVNMLLVESRPASAEPNLDLILEKLNEIKLILCKQKSCESNSNQIELKNKLIEVTMNPNSIGDCRLPNLEDDSNSKSMKSIARIIQLAKHHMVKMDSFKDICTQVAAMYKYSHQMNIAKSERRTDENYTWCGSFHKDIFNEIRTDKNYTWCESFHKDIFNGNCEGVEKFLKEHPLALTAKITVDGNTALHIAVKAKKPEIVRILLEKLKDEKKLRETLEKQNKEGKTALYIAASSGGDPIIAEKLVNTNKDILLVEWYNDETVPFFLFPLFVAAKYNHKKMVRYLYSKMQDHKLKENAATSDKKVDFFPNKKWVRQWASFLADLIYNEDYDMASRVIKDYPNLALSKYTDVETPLFALAQRPSFGANVTFHGKASKFQCPTFICSNKMDDGTASEASKLLENFILTIDDLESQKPALSAALFKAAEVGSVEFVAMFINSLPLVLSWSNDLYQNIFHVAIINRQEKIFNLIYGLDSVKNDLTGSADKFNNWMLHLAGVIAPPNRLNQLPGPAMQLQRELQWFQVVEEIVPKTSIDVKNVGIDGKTPSELFTSTHKDLMKDGENWMRNTASQCSFVAALITTVMFAAAFTLPGGNNQNTGDPIFLGDISFLLFAVADFVALLTSCTSVFIFLAILTSRFAQEDFLISLPMRLIWGLGLLLVSMAAMIFAFCDTIYIIIHHQYDRFCIPIIIGVGLIPVFIFLVMMFPLLFDLWRATRTSIFDKRPSPRIKYY